MIGILLRIAGVEPRPVTSAPAPQLGAPHVDVDDDVDAAGIRVLQAPASATPPVAEPIVVERQEIRVEPRPDVPAIERGVCWHHGHIDHDGHRLGVTVNQAQSFAALLPCPYFNPEGR